MKDILIVGSGGLAAEIKCLIDAINQQRMQWNLLGFIDGWGKQPGEEVFGGFKVVGDINYLNAITTPIAVVVAIGTPQRIKDAIEQIRNPNVTFPNLIHPTAEVNASVKMGIGNIITFCTFVSCGTEMGNFNLFNTKCGVGHHVHIGSFNVFNPNTQISGSVTIGDENFWGLNSSIIQGKSVGNRNKLGGGSMMIRSAQDDGFYFGIPARKQEI